MAKDSSKPKIDAELEGLIKEMVKEARRAGTDKTPAMPVADKFKVIDRALKLELIKHKMDDDEFGTGFDTDD